MEKLHISIGAAAEIHIHVVSLYHTYFRVGRAVIARRITVTVLVAVAITVALYMMTLVVVILTKLSIQLIWIRENRIDRVASARTKQQFLVKRIKHHHRKCIPEIPLTIVRRHYTLDSILEIGPALVPVDSLRVLLVDGSIGCAPFPVSESRNSASPGIRDDSLCDYWMQMGNSLKLELIRFGWKIELTIY